MNAIRLWTGAALVVAGIVWMCSAAYYQDIVVAVCGLATFVAGLVLAYIREE